MACHVGLTMEGIATDKFSLARRLALRYWKHGKRTIRVLADVMAMSRNASTPEKRLRTQALKTYRKTDNFLKLAYLANFFLDWFVVILQNDCTT
jgi:hypothetical protein